MSPSPPRLFTPRRFVDERGWFSETYSEAALAERGITDTFVQDNQSLSRRAGTLRGLHFQRPPHAQAKLVRCVAGAVLDVIVDLRRGSPTYGEWRSARLTAEGGEQLYAPVGYAHGFLTLTDAAEVAYKVSDVYAPECDGGVAWNDPELAVKWGLETPPLVSEKDAALTLLADFVSPFVYDGEPLGDLT